MISVVIPALNEAARLPRTLAGLVEALPDETVVYPGHMGNTTIGRERATNPFLAQLA